MGIDADWLNQNANAQDFRLAPASYDFGKQQQAIFAALTLLKNKLTNLTDHKARWEAVQTWWPHMLLAISVLKNEHFKEEREYRLVRTAHGWPKGIRTRPALQGLVPYLPVRLDQVLIANSRYHPQNCGLECITMGPALPERQKAALEALLASQHMRVEQGDQASYASTC